MASFENTNKVQKALDALAQMFFDYGKATNSDGTLYAVGGYVRNIILGLPISDIDTCSALNPNEVIDLCMQNNLHYVPKGIDFGMVEIHFVCDGVTLFTEHTTFRADKYCDGGFHKPTKVEYATTLEEDAFRRDFTINALYKNILTGEILDPTGGLEDIKRHVLRATSPDPEIILCDDALRIMRLARFAAELGFVIEDATMRVALKRVSNLNNISGERIRDELFKVLLSDMKYPALTRRAKPPCPTNDGEEPNPEHAMHTPETSPVLRGLLLMRDMNIFSVIIPELEACRGYIQKRKFHKYDVMEHIFHTTAETPPRLHMRLAGLFHDIGKPEAHKKNQMKNMHDHDLISAPISKVVMTRLHCPNELISRVYKLVSIHMYDIAGTARINKLRTRFALWGEATTLDLIEFRRADLLGSGNPKRDLDSSVRFGEVYLQMKEDGAPFSMSDLCVNGTDILRALHARPSPTIGRVKTELLKHCAVYPQDNTYTTLIDLSKQFYINLTSENQTPNE